MSDQDLEKWAGRAKIPATLFEGPEDVRNAFMKSKGIDWTASYIDPATWIPQSRTLISYTGTGYDEITRHASKLCTHLGITVREGGLRILTRQAQEAYERDTQSHHRPFVHREAAE